MGWRLVRVGQGGGGCRVGKEAVLGVGKVGQGRV